MWRRHGRVIFAGGILILLLIWVLTQERGRVPEKGEIFGLRTEQANALQVKTESQTVTLRKEGEQWKLEEPVKGWADKDAVERAVNAIARLKAEKRKHIKVSEDKEDKFGLQKPKLTATLTYDGNRTITIYLGKQTPDNSEYYARIEGREELHLVPSYVYNDLTQSVDSLRDKALVHVKKEDIKSVWLQYPDRVLAVEKRGTPEEPKWFLTQPYEAKADEWNAKNLAEKLADLKADGFAPEKPPAGKNYGFDKPMIKATLTMKDGKQFVITFGGKGRETISSTYGSSSETKDVVYVQVAGRPEVLLVADTNMSDLQKTDMDLRDKHLLEIAKERVRQIKVERKKGFSFTVERSGPDSWRIVSPTPMKANRTKVEDILWDVCELEAKEFLGEQQDLKKYGLALADVIVTLTVEGRKEPVKVYIGYQKTDGVYYAKTSESQQVYTVGEMLLLDLPKSLDELKETPPASSASTSSSASSSEKSK